ncbi:pyruvate/2-oxoglutarate dehydrogenase complex, dihydrolipoamide acyltransferase (E2) component [Lentimicrobium saccharophilum]|uniref:Dihydrolipoamide acetyltransferase component of pyruvate dehydrogenase complex n=1 Tax=Lentimicrobium saccharophilum TaxID=1678841 RepID=A0A0S7BVX1_9BACT|nr:dihydrolipoamide acetyltransferase family protein [Lentimicrobium saccharophilum]GAP42715.1 pyruvate/2-oxoglutarate dehydrogenase complex, dihydrolipoamide acyltransferase (E2) component [Lentimicrobium saccharophilum]
MAKFEVIMPKLGESIIEATITKWLKNPGDTIEEDDPIVEIATDKVDSEIPSPVEGKLIQVLFNEGDVVAVGKVIAIIETDPGAASEIAEDVPAAEKSTEAATIQHEDASTTQSSTAVESSSDRFYSPLVKNIARTEGISQVELDAIPGTGKDGRLTKDDLIGYLKDRTASPAKPAAAATAPAPGTASAPASTAAPKVTAPPVVSAAGDEIVEMDRMRKLIADHMVMSKQVSPHVTSFIEVDVTNIVKWRDKVKDEFQKREKEKITFTPIFIEAAAQALKDFPGVNASVDGYKVILRKNVNIGMAAALPNGNLIVPVIKNADQKNLLGLAKDVNSLANKARSNKLEPDDISGGTFTITNLGTFGSITGSPIINQPQVAILGIGVIRKKPVVLETADGDVIAIRHMMILSLSYDHRVVDGALGGMYLQRMQQLLESFDQNRLI